MKVKQTISIILIFTSGLVNAQNRQIADFKSYAWEISAKNHEFKAFKGKQALFLDQGTARLKNSTFKNGIIEYDISFEQKRNFAGVHFHIHDSLNYEEYYLRPHQSGNPDAMQYTPVIKGNAAWQLYSGEGYWSAIDFNFGEWMHIKLIVSEEKMDVYIEDMVTPILQVNDLKLGSVTGGLGFGTFLGAAYYANLTFEEIEDQELVGKPDSEIQAGPNTVKDWKVSNAFPAARLAGLVSLKELDITVENKLKTDAMGILNLSQVSEVTDETNTVLAKFRIDSDREQLKKIDFGYSDKVIVYVNGKPIYSGDNSFRTRDYRYLGSIGYFDSIFLDLQEGSNEIVFAITERMGGWGVRVKLTD